MTGQPGFWMVVTDSGGGMVTGMVRRDTSSYPEEGASVFVSGSGEHDPDIDRAVVTVRLDDLERLVSDRAGQSYSAFQDARARLEAAVNDRLGTTAPREAR